ncbi:MAG: DUF3987 domain-containing protein, partial [Hyphomicrobiales bacterium]
MPYTLKRIQNGALEHLGLASIHNLESYERARKAQRERKQSHQMEAEPGEPWDMDHDPDVLNPARGERPELEEKFLPPQFYTLVHEMARKHATSPHFMLGAMLATAGAVLGGKVRVVLNDGWEQPPIIWAALVGPSGTAKSPAIAKAAGPLFALDEDAKQTYDE